MSLDNNVNHTSIPIDAQGDMVQTTATNWSTAFTGTNASSNTNDSNTTIQSTGIVINGEHGDIKLGNVSLKNFIEQVSLRLNILTVNKELEKQWDELKVLGEAYRACEAECIEKAKVWAILSKP